jgi:pimeloyl-ACP methyl ester carboxylesterase
MWGISGGGPHLLACAALLPGLVTAVASLASLAPLDADGLDYFAGMGQDNVADIQLFLRDREAARAKTESDREAILATSSADMAADMATLLSPADAAVVTDGLASYLATCFHDGLAPGVKGWWDDATAHRQPWGFELSAISVPVLLMHGRQDRFVPFSHGQWLAGHIPGVEARLLDHDGHLSLLASRIPEVHGWLKEQM